MKTALILTGRHEPTPERYKTIERMFVDAGWEHVIPFTPNWELRSISKFTDEILKIIPPNSDPLTIFGFSLGAMLALTVSTKIPVENLILGSPSGYFREYEPLLSENDRAFAREELADFEQWSVGDVLSKIQVKSGHILAGETELKNWPEFNKWVQDLHTETHWPLTIVPDTSHEIEATAYQECMQQVIDSLTS